MKIYTRGGDKGKTAVVGGPRLFKDSPRVETNGEIDEANSSIGLLRAKLPVDHSWQEPLKKIQTDLMNLMSHVATPSDSPRENTVHKPKDGPEFCEKWIDELESEMTSPSDYFLLPGGNEISALCHVVRTQIRRAERRLVTLMHEDTVEEWIPAYINRLSDLFFTLSRAEMDQMGIEEERWRLFIYKSIKKS